MDNPIYIGNGILDQIEEIKNLNKIVITKKGVFDFWMQEFKNFYKKYPYAIEWDYEKFLREILNKH